MSKSRIWLFGLLLFFYLAGVLLLSAVTLNEPSRTNGYGNRVADQSIQIRAPMRKTKIHWCKELRFLDPPKSAVALVSFPGSGNTWLRYLLQQATGIHTGSVYKDYGLLKNGFPAENVVNGSVLVVKTHEWGPLTRQLFAKAVLLVRAPGPAIQAEFNRQSGGHVGFASPDRYKRTRGRYWQQFVSDKLRVWKETNFDWLYNFTGPTHIVFYEQLVENVEHTLRSVLHFLEMPVNEKLMRCALERQEGIYRRKRRVYNFDPYTTAMKKQLEIEQDRVYQAIYGIASPAKRKR